MLRLMLLLILAKMAVSVDPEIHEKYLTLPEQEFIEYFNGRHLSFTIKSYNRSFHLGSHSRGYRRSDYPQRSHVLKDLPKNFDARQQWKDCETISEINDQGNCGSCWTFGTANTASDRTCIHKGIHVNLSEQDFECLKDDVCGGGNPEKAFDFWQNKGLVSNKCKPYDINKLQERQCHTECEDGSISYEQDKHFAYKVYGVAADKDAIKSELVENGSIEAAFNVYEDFQKYGGGIYVHSFGDFKGGHSVRVIGYGEENGVEYWLVANSWGKGWGEGGTFRIKIFQDLLQFEDNLFTGIPKN